MRRGSGFSFIWPCCVGGWEEGSSVFAISFASGTVSWASSSSLYNFSIYELHRALKRALVLHLTTTALYRVVTIGWVSFISKSIQIVFECALFTIPCLWETFLCALSVHRLWILFCLTPESAFDVGYVNMCSSFWVPISDLGDPAGRSCFRFSRTKLLFVNAGWPQTMEQLACWVLTVLMAN